MATKKKLGSPKGEKPSLDPIAQGCGFTSTGKDTPASFLPISNSACRNWNNCLRKLTTIGAWRTAFIVSTISHSSLSPPGFDREHPYGVEQSAPRPALEPVVLPNRCEYLLTICRK
jgi:hypothetical protein